MLMDIFIAYHGDLNTGSEKEAKQIFDLLSKMSKSNGFPLDIYFHPITGKGLPFGKTPLISSESSVFLLVANENVGRNSNGQIEEFKNGERRRLFEEVYAFSESKKYRTSSFACARVITCGQMPLNEAEKLHYIFNGVSHFTLESILENSSSFIELLSQLLNDDIHEISEIEKTLSINCGQTVEFGHWPPRGDAIVWKCFSDTPTRTLLISVNSIDNMPYKKDLIECTWETSDIRKWLNTVFYNEAFNEEEKKKIIKTKFEAYNNPKYLTNGGNPCFDYVAIPSLHDAYYYLKPKNDHFKGGTQYAINKGLFFNNENSNSTYWLRTPGYHNVGACVVDTYGYISRSGNGVNDSTNGIVPMIWIET